MAGLSSASIATRALLPTRNYRETSMCRGLISLRASRLRLMSMARFGNRHRGNEAKMTHAQQTESLMAKILHAARGAFEIKGLCLGVRLALLHGPEPWRRGADHRSASGRDSARRAGDFQCAASMDCSQRFSHALLRDQPSVIAAKRFRLDRPVVNEYPIPLRPVLIKLAEGITQC